MKSNISSFVKGGVALSLLAASCSDSSSFKERTSTKTAPSALEGNPTEPTAPPQTNPEVAASPVGEPPSEASQEPATEEPAILTLEVVLSSKEIRSGKQTLQATAIVKGTANAKVVWSLKGPNAVDAGKIDSNGLYTSPDAMVKETKVVITATLVEDTKVSGKEEVKIIPAEQIFVGCKVGSKIFPILADVYRLPVDTQHLPDFASIANDKITTVCMDQYNVPPRDFNDGFPGVPNLFEWFGLHTVAKIIIPKTGNYSFRLNSDDGAILTIAGNVVINNDGQHEPTALDGSVQLTQGVHDVILDYFQGPADDIALELFWKVPGTRDFIVVPPASFQK